MSSAKFSILLLTLVFSTACSAEKPKKFEDKTNTNQDGPVVYPKAAGSWIEARTFMMKQGDENQQGCDQIDFRVMANSGTFSINQCDKTQSGQLTPDEFKKLDSLTTEAYKQTEGRVCPEIFRFNKFYATINATNDEFDRNFDPDNSCYEGTESVVKSYKNYLGQLLNKYRQDTRN